LPNAYSLAGEASQTPVCRRRELLPPSIGGVRVRLKAKECLRLQVRRLRIVFSIVAVSDGRRPASFSFPSSGTERDGMEWNP
jgi:hypothetical protein